MYQIIWELKVKFKAREAFEKFYGPGGEWVKFFLQSVDYNGTDILASGDDDGVSLIIDEWQSEMAYLNFIKTLNTNYLQLEEKAKLVSRTKNRIWMNQNMEL
jgi:hypothetical protein